MRLTHRYEFQLRPAAPFNFDASLHNPSHFPTPDGEWQPGTSWRTMRWRGYRLGLKFESRGRIEAPCIALSVWSNRVLGPSAQTALIDEINYRYAFSLDLTEFNRRSQNDPLLGPIVARWRGLHPFNYSSLYEYLLIAIVLQNATVRRTVQMMQALFENFGRRVRYDGKEFYGFWTPEEMTTTEEKLRALKVGYRAKSILRVTEAFTRGEIDELTLRGRTREEQRAALLALYGVGPASVGYILADVFHHLDELEHISPWEQKIYSKLFFDRDPEEPVSVERLLKFFDKRFGEYKMLAVSYVWADLWWRRKNEKIEWLEKLIRM